MRSDEPSSPTIEWTPSPASWGCSPTVAHTSSCRAATSMAAADWAASVPTEMNRPTPASRAEARCPSTSSSPGYGRWQWESAHMGLHDPLHRPQHVVERVAPDVGEDDDAGARTGQHREHRGEPVPAAPVRTPPAPVDVAEHPRQS